MKINKILLVLIMFVLLVPLALAQPPFEQSGTFTSGYRINVPLIETFKVNNDIQFNFHVYNNSNGQLVFNDTTGCRFHLFNQSGIPIINNQDIPFDAVGLDYQITVAAGNFSRVGSYSALVNCNSSSFGGFDEFRIVITDTGKESDFNNQTPIFVLITLISFLILIVTGIVVSKSIIWKVLLFIPLILILIVLVNIAILFLEATNPELTGIISVLNTVFYGLLAVAFPSFVVAFIVIAKGMVQSLFNKRHKNEKEWDEKW